MKFFLPEFIFLVKQAAATPLVDPEWAQFACIAGCDYRVGNILQLQACGSAHMLDKYTTHDYIHCEVLGTEKECVASTNPPCAWTTYTGGEPAGNKGACGLANFFSFYVLQGLNTLYGTLAENNITNPPSPAEEFDCIAKSFGTEEDCNKSFDRAGRPCAWCPDVPSEILQFDNPPFKNLCSHKQWIDGICKLIKQDAPTCSGVKPATTKSPKPASSVTITSAPSSSAPTSTAPTSTAPTSTAPTSTDTDELPTKKTGPSAITSSILAIAIGVLAAIFAF